jgi:sec-independent protein translocase protein TatA
MGRIGTTEIILIVIVILVLFGAKRIPQLMRGLGSGVSEFKKGMRGEVDEDKASQAKKAEENTSGEDKPA